MQFIQEVGLLDPGPKLGPWFRPFVLFSHHSANPSFEQAVPHSCFAPAEAPVENTRTHAHTHTHTEALFKPFCTSVLSRPSTPLIYLHHKSQSLSVLR